MLFHVTVQIELADGSCMDGISFNVHAESEEDVRERVTPELLMKHLSDNWEPPIANVSVKTTQAPQKEDTDSAM